MTRENLAKLSDKSGAEAINHGAGCAEDKDLGEGRIILIDKPAGMSSFGAVARVRRRLSEEAGHKVKVGHTGTLDPFATGLLVLLAGKATKRAGEFLRLRKTYEATMKLGFVSTTGDPEGEVVPFVGSASRGALANRFFSEADGLGQPIVVSLQEIERAVGEFLGEIEQKVPRFSAVKVNGERAYRLARKGAEFETPTRKVNVYEIEILEYEYPELKIRAEVSSGTYIRTLAEDIGEALGTGAYLTALRRTRVGEYRVEDAERLPEEE